MSNSLPMIAAVRAYSQTPNKRPLSETAKFRKPENISDWQIIFDTETTVDVIHKLRIGVCQIRKAGQLKRECIFVADDLSNADLATVRAYCAANDLYLITLHEFRTDILLKIGYLANASIIGFNLPFDISRVALEAGIARGSMRGGFTFSLSEWKSDPNIRIKHLNATASLIDFAKPGKQLDGRGMRNRKIRQDHNRGVFLDVKTLAAALLTGRFTLKSLAERLETCSQKRSTEEHGGPIAFEYLDYARADVQTTWECYETLAAMYAEFELSTPLHRILSEASLGKALLSEMDIKPLLYDGWKGLQPETFGSIMATYFGGRAEVRIRRQAVEVIHTDFKSMYPTVNALLGLHAFLIADRFEQYEATDEAQEFLNSVELTDLQDPAVWKRLHTIVKITPNGEVLPLRGAYTPGKDHLTIGLNHVRSKLPLWYTLSDLVTSKLLTGKTPQIQQAIGFRPGKVQSKLAAINLLGRSDYRIDPAQDDMFVSLINMRDEAKAQKDQIEKRLKILANATCYGIYAEVIRDDHPKPKDLDIHGPDGSSFPCSTKAVEEPGKFFNPLLAALITGTARLMLACAERVARDEGLGWAFCDTDSIALAKPESLPRAEFHERAKRVIDWFETLNPYDKPGSILQVEDVNFRPGTSAQEPLYCFAISAKRYALFNLDETGHPILRKASAHGLGHLMAPYGDDDPAQGVPNPSMCLSKIGVRRWQYDLWYHIIKAALDGHPNQVALDYHPALLKPATMRYGATSPALLSWMKRFNAGKPYQEQVKPFGFMVAPIIKPDAFDPFDAAVVERAERGRPKKSVALKPIAPFSKDGEVAASMAFDRETGEPVPHECLKTYADTLRLYHLSAEFKFENGEPWDIGATVRRTVLVEGFQLIGKEANKVGDFGESDPTTNANCSFTKSRFVVPPEIARMTVQLD